MRITKNGYIFEIDHYTEYDNYSTVTISFESIPMGYFDSLVENRSCETIRNEYELESFAEQWLVERQ